MNREFTITDSQLREWITDWTMLYCNGLQVNAMDLQRAFKDRFSMSVDWHEFSIVLDRLAQSDKAEHVKIDRFGMNVYKITYGSSGMDKS
jgi:hypothetical protein